MITLDGELNIQNQFDGELETKNEYDGELNITVGTGGIREYYEGEYSIIPKADAQILDTEEKYMEQDLEVQAIPYAEVSNLAGGKTVIIA